LEYQGHQSNGKWPIALCMGIVKIKANNICHRDTVFTSIREPLQATLWLLYQRNSKFFNTATLSRLWHKWNLRYCNSENEDYCFWGYNTMLFCTC
jgi:hypothetical protein